MVDHLFPRHGVLHAQADAGIILPQQTTAGLMLQSQSGRGIMQSLGALSSDAEMAGRHRHCNTHSVNSPGWWGAQTAAAAIRQQPDMGWNTAVVQQHTTSCACGEVVQVWIDTASGRQTLACYLKLQKQQAQAQSSKQQACVTICAAGGKRTAGILLCRQGL